MTNKLSSFSRSAIAIAVGLTFIPFSHAEISTQEADIERITVTADVNKTQLNQLAASASVLVEDEITLRQAEYLDQMLALTPNVNFATGASRGRFIQIRGIGERSQFQEPVNPSVGFILDDIDLSGLGGAATMYDVAQLEVLRGPQGTQYGTSAMAGLVKLKTNDPTEIWQGRLDATLAQDNTWALGGAVGGALSDSVQFRAALHQFSSDGFIYNSHLNDETADRDELTGRLKLRWLIDEDTTLDLNWHHIDNDNGYDNFTFDNSRTSLSDNPGQDKTELDGFSAKLTSDAADYATWVITASFSTADLNYSYDEDWTYEGFHPDGYSSTDSYDRERDALILDTKLYSKESSKLFNGSTDWVIGLYYRDESEDLSRLYTYSDPFSSDYDTEQLALYGQLTSQLNDKWTLITGLRVEQRDVDYSDSDSFSHSPDETMVGGKVALNYQLSNTTMVYGLIARGYKAGGINADNQLPEERRSFDSEYTWNYETGVKTFWTETGVSLRAALFYMDRDDQQLAASFAKPIEGTDCPCEFIDFIDNSTSGNNYGLELESSWQINESLSLFASAGLLQTEFDDYVRVDGTDISGRDQSQAPHYQYAIAGQYDFNDHWFARLELEGKDNYYFSDSHEEKGVNANLMNVRVGYQQDNWSIVLWGRNITDETWYTRGFGGFGNNPANGYATEAYYQLADPAQWGLTANYNF